MCEIFLRPKEIRQAQDAAGEGVSGNCARYTFIFTDSTQEGFLQVFRPAIWQEQAGI